MKKVLLPLFVVATAFLTACVPSLQPLYTPESTIFRDELIGIWKEKPADEESWTFTRNDNNVYNLTIREKEESSILEARLVKLGEHLFLDLYPSGEAINNAKFGDFFRAALVPGHLILKVKLGPKLELQLLQGEKLAEMLKAEPKSLGHTFLEGDRLLITAPTAELQEFVKKNVESKELWGDPGVMQKFIL